MPGPYSSDHHLGPDGPPFTDTHPSEPLPAPPGFPPSPPGAFYPGPLPPPLPYPKSRRRGLLTGGAVALLVIAAVVAAILHGSHRAPAVASAEAGTLDHFLTRK